MTSCDVGRRQELALDVHARRTVDVNLVRGGDRHARVVAAVHALEHREVPRGRLGVDQELGSGQAGGNAVDAGRARGEPAREEV